MIVMLQERYYNVMGAQIASVKDVTVQSRGILYEHKKIVLYHHI